MLFRRKWRTQLCALVATACALSIAGCASWQGPRIDPTGERILIWPGQAPPVVAPPPTLPTVTIPAAPGTTLPPVISTPPPPPPSVGLPTGNLQVPPAYPDTGLPTAPAPVTTVPSTPRPTAAPASTIPSAAPPAAPPPSVDAQIAFPAPAVAQAGFPLVLTTMVTRRTDRVPLAGWTVRYEVTGAGATLNSAGVNRVEIPTDASGRASMHIRPTSAGVGEAVVNIAVIAPPELTAAESSAVEVGRSTATITWKEGVPGAPPWLPPPPGPATAMPSPSLVGPSSPESPSGSTSPAYPGEQAPNRFEPPPSLSESSRSDSASPPETYSPPPKQEPAGKPELTVEVHRRGPEKVEVGGFASFDVVVTNRGDATARGIKVLDRFDPGLTHVKAKDDEHAVKYEGMRDLAPGESATVPLTFGVQAAGEQCHTVTITAEGAATVVKRGCVTAVESKPATPPALEVTKQGPVRHYVNETALFHVIIKNTGGVPVTNIVLTDQYDPALEARFSDAGAETLPDGRLRWRIPRLEKGEQRQFQVKCTCVSPARSACSRVTVTADGDLSYADEKCVEILPLETPTPGTSDGVAPPPPL